jgi:hypothetical protein
MGHKGSVCLSDEFQNDQARKLTFPKNKSFFSIKITLPILAGKFSETVYNNYESLAHQLLSLDTHK